MVVAILTFAASSILVDIPVEHVLVLVPGLFLVGFFFAQMGVLVGVRAEQFDDVSTAQTFVLQPLIFLGGVFYWPAAAAAVRDDDPLRPDLLHDHPGRYGFLGYSETSVGVSLLPVLATAALLAFNYRLFARLQVARVDAGCLRCYGRPRWGSRRFAGGVWGCAWLVWCSPRRPRRRDLDPSFGSEGRSSPTSASRMTRRGTSPCRATDGLSSSAPCWPATQPRGHRTRPSPATDACPASPRESRSSPTG